MPKAASNVEIKPWGHSLFIPIRDASGIVALEDRYGRRWGGVREAFWVAELHMCGCSHMIINQQLHQMADVLTACASPDHDRASPAACFGKNGTIHFMVYMHWLSGLGLTDHGETPFDGARLSDRGRAVHEMIRLTMPERIGCEEPRWFPEPKRSVAPRHERRRSQKQLPAPDAVPA